MLGFFIIVILDYHKIFGSIIIGIVLITVAGILLGVSQFYGIFSYPPSIKPTLLALQFKDIFHLQGISVLFALFLVVFFDGTGTLLGFLQQPEFARDGSARMPFFSRALFADCIATIFGSLVGTSSTSPFIESAAGIRVGGRTGLTTLTIAILFLLALFLSPLAKTVPLYAVAPALLYVGVLMIRNIIRLNWNDFSEILPCLITMFMIPFSFSIADGLGCGVISYNAIKLICGKTKDLNWVLFILGLIFIAYFIFRPE
jgi:AGZA family xanthine/uracil permease-like MFS transporter